MYHHSGRRLIRPVPKIKNPTAAADFRPISVLPILSRMVERIVVRIYLYPAIHDPQYSGKNCGSIHLPAYWLNHGGLNSVVPAAVRFASK